jgi:hypothetical protein
MLAAFQKTDIDRRSECDGVREREKEGKREREKERKENRQMIVNTVDV